MSDRSRHLAMVESLNSVSAHEFEIEMLVIVAEEAAVSVEGVYVRHSQQRGPGAFRGDHRAADNPD